MKKFNKIWYLTEEPSIADMDDLRISEKYDGSQGRITLENGEIVFGTRGPESRDPMFFPKPYCDFFLELMIRINKLPDSIRVILEDILDRIVVFFEMCGTDEQHRIVYDKEKMWVVFDGWDKKEEKYISTDHLGVKMVSNYLDLDIARRLPFKTYNQAKEWLYKQDHRKIEGVVVKNYREQKRVKILHPKNKEIECAIFKAPRGSPNYYESKFIHSYVTTNRIHKIMLALKAFSVKNIKDILVELKRDLIMECLPHFILSEGPKSLNLEHVYKNFPKVAVPIIRRLIQERN